MGFGTITALGEATGLSTRILGDLEHGRKTSYRPATLNKVESALAWNPGAILAIVGGAEPSGSGSSDNWVDSHRVKVMTEDPLPGPLTSEDLIVRGKSSTDLFEGIEARLSELRRRYESVDEEVAEEPVKMEIFNDIFEGMDTDETVQKLNDDLAKEDVDLVADDGGGHGHEDEDEQTNEST